MNQQAFEAGRNAYRQGDLMGAVAQLSAAKGPGEVSGAVDHLLGNCLMKLGRYAEAADSYGDALRDGSYGHKGALACNRGRALLAAGKVQEAIASLTLATKDSEYPTPYKAYVALGNAYKKMGNVREAGVAFRNAAIDETNPDPASALRELGGCFMQMGRAVDAVEAYRTALDFSTPLQNQNAIYGDLGLAYVAANRMSEAVDAFNHATSDGSYTLQPEAQAAFDAAKKAVAAIAGDGPSETDAFLAAAGYGTGTYDPLDPTGATGDIMPSPEDTGFFSVSEEDLERKDKSERKVRRKRKHRGLKVFLVILLILVLLGGAGAFAYTRGYGWPMQDEVVQQMFSANASGDDISQFLSPSLSSDQSAEIKSLLPTGDTTVTIDGVDRSMTESTVLATAKLAAGGTQTYTIKLVRDGIGWKVSDVSATYASQSDGSASLTSSSTDTADSSVTSASSASADSSSSTSGTTTSGTISGE